MFTIIATANSYYDHHNYVESERLLGIFPTFEEARSAAEKLAKEAFTKAWEEAYSQIPAEIREQQGPCIIDP